MGQVEKILNKFFFRDTETGGRRGSFKKEFVGDNFKGFKEKVTIKSFDTIISQFGKPNFIKVDVEGFEENVIAGLTNELERCVFLIETREETKQEIFEYFDKKGYECIWIDNQEIQINKVEEIPGFANLIFKKSQQRTQHTPVIPPIRSHAVYARPLCPIKKKANRTNSTFGFCRHTKPTLKKPKEPNFAGV